LKVELVEYNPDWAKMYEVMKKTFYTSFGDKIAAIEHVGSTSVPGLCAKPIIDIMLGVTKLPDADDIISKMYELGFEYVSKYEDVMPYRRYFVIRENGKSTYHIHTVEVDSHFWKRHLLFRDYLRQNPQARDEYGKLKKDLAQIEWNDRNEYTDAKTEFISNIQDIAARAKQGSKLK
jgi:GrpB-like predicted nucleotidyltransferase (UPF0157 family)